MTVDDLAELRREHTLHSGGYFFDAVVDYAVGADLDVLARGAVDRRFVGSYVESDDYRVRRGGEHYVALVYRACGVVNDVDFDFFV